MGSGGSGGGADDKGPRPLKNASILVVEDHTFVRDLLERMLSSRVGKLHGAVSAEDAFYNLEKIPGLAHVAIVDYQLPGMNGLKFIEKLRSSKTPALKALPVIVMTGTNDMDLYRSAARLGISAFLIKPVAAATVVEALEGALAGRKVAIPRLNVDTQIITESPDRPAPNSRLGRAPDADEMPPHPAAPHAPIDFKT
jgi:CheY-like chemotaxis protein